MADSQDEGRLVADVAIRHGDKLRLRRLLFNLVWTGFCFGLVWLAVTTPFVFFLLSPIGVASFAFGAVLSLLLQVRGAWRWTSRLPQEIPAVRRHFGWRQFVAALAGTILANLTVVGIRLFLPEVVWILAVGVSALLTFVLGVFVVGFWPALVVQLLWETRAGKIIVKQGKYWVGLAPGAKRLKPCAALSSDREST
jgi:hypothetical protein